jgi:hypothetical protein
VTKIFWEQVLAVASRPQLGAVLEAVRQDDALVVTSILPCSAASSSRRYRRSNSLGELPGANSVDDPEQLRVLCCIPGRQPILKDLCRPPGDVAGMKSSPSLGIIGSEPHQPLAFEEQLLADLLKLAIVIGQDGHVLRIDAMLLTTGHPDLRPAGKLGLWLTMGEAVHQGSDQLLRTLDLEDRVLAGA